MTESLFSILSVLVLFMNKISGKGVEQIFIMFVEDLDIEGLFIHNSLLCIIHYIHYPLLIIIIVIISARRLCFHSVCLSVSLLVCLLVSLFVCLSAAKISEKVLDQCPCLCKWKG